ncbi:MAG TPA: hypothetical protein PKX79_08140 [Spirochaetota bacterium]|nr:hypothetical protein [Spirochaetota bacterium]HOK92157.1 hypothetical protein [Spirochaetota bacterium]HPP95333.1 hypothetical protein [Spirochaetota bacterium]
MKRFALFIFIILSASLWGQAFEDLQIKPIDADRLKLFPVPVDNRNYFFLQSINNKTQIVIGDFSEGSEKKIVLITLGNDYNTIKSVTEYYPQSKDLRVLKESTSRFFTKDIAKLKKDIITGAIFEKNNTDKMRSLDALEDIFKKNQSRNIFPDTYGFTVKLSEVDERTIPMALFTFGKSETGYYLQFKTEYYRINARFTAKPVLQYSVYCKNTGDPIVSEIVEDLFKIREPNAYKIQKLEKGN